MAFKDLENAIKNASQKYYTDGSSPVSDEEFDSMLNELKEKDPDNELVTAVGHGYDVDEYVMKTGKKKVKHKYGIVGSLEKAYSWEELKPAIKHGMLDVSLKLDGLSVALYYTEGVFIQALTRGVDGWGIDITKKVWEILSPTEHVLEDRTFTGSVRGEIIMPDWEFERYKKEIDAEAKNSRNTAAGIINSKEADATLLSFLEVRVYSIIGCESIEFERHPSNEVTSLLDMRAWLMNNFIATVPYWECVHLFEESYKDELDVIYADLSKDLPADGLVLTQLVETAENHQVLYTSQAFKFKAESGETTVTNIKWNLTKTRYLMPKLNVEPLYLSGTNVENATGYNAAWIRDNNIGVGSVIEISKHGEIIPNVDKVIKATGAELPDRCPECGELLSWNGVHLQCNNALCGNAQIQDLLIWLQNLVPVDYLGDKLKLKWLEEFYDTDQLSIPIVMSGLPYLPYIADNAEHNLGIQGKAVADMLLDLYRKEFRLVDVIKALNIPRFGDVNANKLAEYPELIKALYLARKTRMKDMVLENEVSAIDYQTSLMLAENEYVSKIGTANMNSLIQNIYKFDNLKYIWDRIDFSKPATTSQHEFKGKVAITGKLSVKRADFEAELRVAGYEPKEIAKDTKFLITDNPDSASSKNKKADEWGIVKISEEEFRKQYLS